MEKPQDDSWKEFHKGLMQAIEVWIVAECEDFPSIWKEMIKDDIVNKAYRLWKYEREKK